MTPAPESSNPNQLLEAAKTAQAKITPLPPIQPGKTEGLLDHYDKRFDFLELVDEFGTTPEDKLGGKTPAEKLKEEGLAQDSARSIYEILMLASYPQDQTGYPDDFQKALPATLESVPPFLTRLSLGEELLSLIEPTWRLDIDALASQGQKAIQDEYNLIVGRLNDFAQKDTLATGERLIVTKDVLSLLVLVSHPKTKDIVKDDIIPPEQPDQQPIPLSAVAATYLDTYKLGPEMGRMITLGERPVDEQQVMIDKLQAENEGLRNQIRALEEALRLAEGREAELIQRAVLEGAGQLALDTKTIQVITEALASPAYPLDGLKPELAAVILQLRQALEKAVEDRAKKMASRTGKLTIKEDQKPPAGKPVTPPSASTVGFEDIDL